jgi:hypothetical protein
MNQKHYNMKEHIGLTAVIFLIITGLAAQQPKSGGERQPPQTVESRDKPANTSIKDEATASKSSVNEELNSAEIESFVMHAESAPAEFTADLLIQLAESGQIKDAKRKEDLLVESFYAAAKAKHPFKLLALPGSAVDSQSGYRSNALRFNLDGLSLQCRAIKALLALDKQKARELFSEIKVKLDPLNCEDALVYDVSCFYETIQAIAQTAFSTEETRRGEHVYFVENYISKISSPVQIEPAVKILLPLKTTDSQLLSLVRTFSAALEKVSKDDRSFSVSWNATIGPLDELISRCKQRGVFGDEIIQSYKIYLIKQLSSSRCADTASRKEQKELERNLITQFNDRLRGLAYKNIPAISEDDIKPAKSEGSAKYEMYWTSPKAKSILSRVRKLRFSSAAKAVDDLEKQSADWQSQLSQLMTELASWQPEDEKSEEDYFHQKCVIFYGLINTIPAGTQYDDVLRDFATFVGSSKLQTENPAEWFLHAKTLIDRVNSSKDGERSKLVDLISYSRSTILYLYVEKQKLLSPPAK